MKLYLPQITYLAILSSLCSICILPNQLYAVYGKSLYWPTSNKSYLENRLKEPVLQATASGRIKSGDWGCSRNNNFKFHEGIDLKSIKRNSKGIAQDKIFAIAAGTVAHVSNTVGDSNYGKYIVITHVSKGIEWCSLYAHLRSIDANVRPGSNITAGQKIAVMGHTSSSIKIPESRSHLHFEIALRNSSRFQKWYAKQNYSSLNKHSSWNGMNLMGVNPFEFYDYFLNHPENDFFSFFLTEPVSFEILVYFKKMPDYLLRNPVFLRGTKLKRGPSWYKIGFTWYGLPVSWKADDGNATNASFDKNKIHIIQMKHEKSCRNWVDDSAHGFVPTNLLKKHISILKSGD